jgi:predicted amidohydrolase
MVLERDRSALTAPAAALDASPERAPIPDPLGAVVVALAQIAPRLGDVATNLERHLAVIEEAADNGAGLVVFPELSLTGYFLKDLVPDVALRLDAPQLAALAAASRGIDVVTGCVIETDTTLFHNAALYFSHGQRLHVHNKVYLPTYGIFDEQRYLAAGDHFRTFQVPLGGSGSTPWRAGILTCEDMWHPSAAAILGRQGIDIFLCPSASPGRGVMRDEALGTARSYDAITRTYAQLYTAYVVYCNRVGFEDGIGFWGGSRIVGPKGSPVDEPAGLDEALTYVRIDRASIRRARIAYPLLRDERHDVNDSEIDRIRRRITGD